MESEGTLPCSQAPATCPYPEPDQASPCHHIPLLEDPFQYYPLRSSKWPFPLGLPPKPLYAALLSPICAICSAHFILLGLISQIVVGEEYRL